MLCGAAILVLALVVAHNLQRTVGNNLVYVHIGRCSCTTLYEVDGELVAQCALHNLLASLFNGCTNCLVERAKRHIGVSGSPLYHSQSLYVIRVLTYRKAAYIFKVNQCSQCLSSIIRIGRDLNLAQRIVFKTCLHYLKI